MQSEYSEVTPMSVFCPDNITPQARSTSACGQALQSAILVGYPEPVQRRTNKHLD